MSESIHFVCVAFKTIIYMQCWASYFKKIKQIQLLVTSPKKLLTKVVTLLQIIKVTSYCGK